MVALEICFVKTACLLGTYDEFLYLSKNLFTKVSFSHQIVECWLHVWEPMSLVYIMDNKSSPFLHSELSFTSREVAFHFIIITADNGEKHTGFVR